MRPDLRFFALFYAMTIASASPSFSQKNPQMQTPMQSQKDRPIAGGIGAAELEKSRGEADQQFLALVHARDRQLAVITEFKGIHVYHSGLRARLEQTTSGFQDVFPRAAQKIVEALDAEMARTEKLEKDVKSQTDNATQNQLAKKFDEDYPLFRPIDDDVFPDNIRRLPTTTSSLSKVVSLTRAERQTVAVLFQNVSSENREIINQYDDVFAKLDQFAREAIKGPKLAGLDGLPQSFRVLSTGQDFRPATNWALTQEQILDGINKYKVALRSARDQAVTITRNPVETLLSQIAEIVNSIENKLKRGEESASALVNDLEKNIASSARSIYGNAVGSDSFNYLLVVFALVFAIIMIVPKLYSSEVALNILKAEFLLQFSTVFVLIAAIIILGIGKLIAPDQLPVLLAGISGYVLGQLGRGNNVVAAAPAPQPAPPPQPQPGGP